MRFHIRTIDNINQFPVNHKSNPEMKLYPVEIKKSDGYKTVAIHKNNDHSFEPAIIKHNQ